MRRFLLQNLVMPLSSVVTENKAWRYHEQYLESEFEDDAVRDARTADLLSCAVRNAYEYVPFYRRKFDEVSLRPADIRGVKDLHRVPITTRLELQGLPLDQRRSGQYHDADLRYSSTSGTTLGCALRLAHDKDAVNHKYAAKLRSWAMMGSTVGDSVLRITPGENQACLIDGARPELGVGDVVDQFKGTEDRRQKRFMFLEDKVVGPLLHRKRDLSPENGYLSPEEAESYLDVIRSCRPDVITAHPLYMRGLAQLAADLGIRPPAPRFVELTSGVSSPGMRDAISRRFDAPVGQVWGCCEFGRIAATCPHSSGLMHILDTFCLVEVVDNRGYPVPDGELGNIVVTSLVDRAVPFIRYAQGDVGRISTQRCTCGRHTPLMDVEGRAQHVIMRGDTPLTTERFFQVLLDDAAVGLFRVEQVRQDHFRLTVEPGVGADLEEAYVAELARSCLGSETRVDVEIVDLIEPSASRKHVSVVSRSFRRFEYR